MENWENLCGENNWEGLLEPLDDNLRRLIIHYGEMVEATYTAYDSDENSTTGCKYNKENLFSEVGLGKGFAKKEYTITHFIYATASFTPFDKDTNWMGYIAVATDERKNELGRRDIVVAWRGTKELSEWSKNMLALKKPASKIFGQHRRSIWDSTKYTQPENKKSRMCKKSARDQVLEEVGRLLKKYKNETVRVIVTGHSLGGALTILNAVDIAINVSPQPHVTAFPFACPQVGGSELRDFVDKYKANFHILRIENKPDYVPDLLRIDNVLEKLFHEVKDKIYDGIDWIKNLINLKPHLPKHIGFYKDVGEVLLVDTDKSNDLKEVGLINYVRMTHDMEIYLHGVSGTLGGANAGFKKVERDIALVNKHGDYLEDSHDIPTSWWDKPDKAKMNLLIFHLDNSLEYLGEEFNQFIKEEWMTQEEVRNGAPPKLDNLKVFGCVVYMHQQDEKLDPRVKKYKVQDSESRSFREAMEIKERTEWKRSMAEEIPSLDKNKMWEVVDKIKN
ncbi:phospholipase A1-II 1-like [Impatiens glandulifera]|uniref:phospholipase A1-II 1-like n=1 Tax=Impatiens glandulifera TaxID=253017 RepID=UPI001FB14119|nr:phospholipase A1-II 1-like [Impatiens glandulifera]